MGLRDVGQFGVEHAGEGEQVALGSAAPRAAVECAAEAPSTCCRWSREWRDGLETGIDRRDYAAIATPVTSAHVANA